MDRLAAAADVDIGDDFDALPRSHCRGGTISSIARAAGFRTTGSTRSTPTTTPQAKIRAAFQRLRAGKELSTPTRYASSSRPCSTSSPLLDHAKGWTQQFHIGALRNNNTRMFAALGPDTGFDSIGDCLLARPMSRFFDRLDRDDRLAKTILYNLNPAHNDVLATMIGNFQDGRTPGKMQFGSGWWFLDQKDGMEQQIDALSNQGLLSRFVGMLTDSRSFLSYTRHEYFRRILCNLPGHGNGAGPVAERRGTRRPHGARHLLPQRRAVLRLWAVGSACSSHPASPYFSPDGKKCRQCAFP